MKTKEILIKIALVASGIAVMSLATANAADSESNVSDETVIVNSDTAANPDALCPNGKPRGTRAQDCTVGKKGRKGNFAQSRGNSGRQGKFANGRGNNSRRGNFANDRGNGGRGNMARAGGRQGNVEGRRGMGPGKGQGDGKGPHDGSCVQAPTDTAES